MSDCPNFRHLMITRPDVLKARIGFAFSKIPKWFTCEVIVPFVITRLALLLVGWLGFRLLPLPVAFPSAWEIGPDGNRHAVVDHISPTSHPWVNLLSRWDAAWSRLQGMGIAMSLAFPVHHDKLDFGFLLVPLGAAIAGLTRLRFSYSAYI